MTDTVESRAAENWFGYGHWEAPYWFVGLEQGGTEDHSTYSVWQDLGEPELSDCKEHHLKSGFKKWHQGANPPVQSTWLRLIQLLLSYQNRDASTESARAYQQLKWSSRSGETAVMNLSVLHAPSLKADVKRHLFRDERIARMRARMEQYGPEFVVCYGSARSDFERLVGEQFDEDGLAIHNSTVCILTAHPIARGHNVPLIWTELGRKLRRYQQATVRRG